MKLDTAAAVEQLCWSLREADWPRAADRSRIQQLFNGTPPYSSQEVRENGIVVNVNYLESTRLSHDARSQYFGAFLKPGNYFKSTTDMGTKSKRQERSAIVTSELQKIMKASTCYFETMRSKFASLVLHGIAPTAWDSESAWCPDMIGVGDTLVPARTYLTMKNLPFQVFARSYTVPELKKLVRGPKVDPAWNMDLIDKLMSWIDRQTLALMGASWPEIWSTEKLEERIKGDGGFYTSDNVPTIDVFDVYCYEEDEEGSGWERRMILDRWTSPLNGGEKLDVRSGMEFAKNQWLYNSKRRKFAQNLSEICCYQFADLSAAAPFQYHSVRSLGFLLYAVCTIQNRLRCKFTESVFENLMMLMRVKTLDDVERALKVFLINRGFVDESVQFIPQAERHQINTALVQLGLNENSRLINENAQSYRALEMPDDRTRKTKAQVMSELNATTALVQAGLMQAYEYQKPEHREIFRRFCRPNSRDPDVRRFRANVLRRGVPEKMLVPEAWEHEPERVMGAGNKALELEISERLMASRQLFDPDPQRLILRDWTLAITDDPGRAEAYVPEARTKVTDSVHDAQLAAGTLLQGLPVAIKTGYNHAEYAQTLLQAMQGIVQRGLQSGGMISPEQILGLQNMEQHVKQHLAILAQDKTAKPIVKQLSDALTKIMNDVKGFAQRLQQQQEAAAKAQQQGNGGLDPKDAAKIQATMMMAQVKADNQSKSQAQRAAQRQLQFEREMKQREQEHRLEMQQRHATASHELAVNRTDHLRSLSE